MEQQDTMVIKELRNMIGLSSDFFAQQQHIEYERVKNLLEEMIKDALDAIRHPGLYELQVRVLKVK